MRRMTAVLAVLVCAGARAQQPMDFAGAHDQFTPVVMQATLRPVPFAGTDGMTHLDYELQLINAQKDAVGVEAIEVLDAESGKVLLKLAGDDVKKWFTLLDKAPATKIGAGQVGYAWLDVKFSGAAAGRLKDRLTG